MASIRLPVELESSLDELVSKTGRAKSYYIIEAIKQYLEMNEERFLLENCIKEFYAGEQASYSITEARNALGLKKRKR